MSSAIPFRSLITSAVAGTLLCLRAHPVSAESADPIVFESHRTVFENDVVSLDFQLLYPVDGYSNRIVQALQEQIVKDSFPAHQIDVPRAVAPRPDLSIASRTPAALINDRVRFYRERRAEILHDRRDIQQTVAVQHTHQAIIPAVSVSSKLIAWKSCHWSYTGGAHGNGYTAARLLDASTGAVVSAMDLWERESVPAIRRAVVRGLVRSLELPPSSRFLDLPVDCEQQDLPLSNVFADAKGLTFIYSPYEIGSYAQGYFTAEVPWRELAPHLKPKWRSLATVSWRTIENKAKH